MINNIKYFNGLPEHRAVINNTFTDYNQQEFIRFVLDQYVNEGVLELSPEKLTDLLTLKYGDVNDAIAELGAPSGIREVFVSFQKFLYE